MKCYYVQNADAVRGKDRFNLAVDPPPDLALEVDITSRSLKREPVYRAGCPGAVAVSISSPHDPTARPRQDLFGQRNQCGLSISSHCHV